MVLYERSADGGRTWGARLEVPETWATSRETPTIHRVVDAHGVERLILFSGLYPIRMAVSEDDGRTTSTMNIRYDSPAARDMVLDAVYPPRCLACPEPTEAAHGLCAACWRDSPRWSCTTRAGPT